MTPEQAKRWKQRELQTAIRLNRSAILLADFRSAREGREPLDTGTWMDNNVPYLTPPAEALQWSEKQVERVRNWVQEEDVASEPCRQAEGREAAMVEQRRQELECL